MDTFPKFTLAGYRNLMAALLERGAQVSPMSKIKRPEANDIYLRHDVDLSLELALPMARVEKEMGVASTYYVLLSGPYNPLSKASISALLELTGLGHRLGLHYDLSLYPSESDEALEKLSREVELLAMISGSTVDTIVMHLPYRGHTDLFEASQRWINPSFYQKNDAELMYVSDSCRAWRDQALLHYLRRESSKSRLLLNVHPEVWLADKEQHRLTYLEGTLSQRLMDPMQRYLAETVRPVWQSHPAAVNGYGDEDE